MCLERETGLDGPGVESLRERIGGALRLSIKTGAGEIELEMKRRTPRTRHRSLKLGGSIACGDDAIEPQQREQGRALLRRHLGFDGDVTMQELVEIGIAQVRGARLGRDRGRTLELRRVEIDRGKRIGAIGARGFLVDSER